MKLLPALCALIICIWTSVALFGQTAQGNREALFTTAFEQLPWVVSFLVSSPDFLATLEESEKDQLRKLYSVSELISQVRQFQNSPEFVSAMAPQGLPELSFLDSRKEFVLHLEEPERMAKTTGVPSEPIFVNRQYINSNEIDPSYLLVVQLLFHELGHKLGDQEITEVMNSLGAKMVQHLKPYFQSKTFANGVKVEILSLPQKYSPVSFEPMQTVKVLIQDRAIVNSHILDLAKSISALERFTPSESGSGNIFEQLSFRITNLSGAAKGFHAELRFNLETSSHLILMDPELQLRPGAASGSSQIMAPRPSLYALLAPTNMNVRAEVTINAPRADGFTQYYIPSIKRWNYSDASLDFLISDVRVSEGEVALAMNNPKKSVTEVQLRLQTSSGELLVAGEKVSQGAESGQLGRTEFRFYLPELATSERVTLQDVIVNKTQSSLLPEVLTLPQASVGAPKAESPKGQIGISWLRGSEWVPFSQEGVTHLEDTNIRFRIVVRGHVPIAQIRLRWNQAAQLSFNKAENVFGTFSTIQEEVINHPRQVLATENSITYEFESREFQTLSTPTSKTSIVGVSDSGRRFLNEMAITSGNMETTNFVFSPMLRIFNREFLGFTPKQCFRLFSR